MVDTAGCLIRIQHRSIPEGTNTDSAMVDTRGCLKWIQHRSILEGI